MNFAMIPGRCKLLIENKHIEQVMQFQYLGVNIPCFQDPVKYLTS